MKDIYLILCVIFLFLITVFSFGAFKYYEDGLEHGLRTLRETEMILKDLICGVLEE